MWRAAAASSLFISCSVMAYARPISGVLAKPPRPRRDKTASTCAVKIADRISGDGICGPLSIDLSPVSVFLAARAAFKEGAASVRRLS